LPNKSSNCTATFRTLYFSADINGSEMLETHSTHASDEKLSDELKGKNTWKIKCRWKYNIKMNVTQFGFK
jgi:hypothetical protein